MVYHIQLVLFVGFFEQVTIHERLARADFDLDLVTLLPLHGSFGDEDLGTDRLQVTVELLALVEVLSGLIIARVICEEVSENTQFLLR